MILRFDFHEHFENQIANQIPIFQCDFKNLKIVQKLFKIRFCKIANQIVEYPAASWIVYTQFKDVHRSLRGHLAHYLV
jgi:hypothetical protein